jgi:hypothetical protein
MFGFHQVPPQLRGPRIPRLRTPRIPVLQAPIETPRFSRLDQIVAWAKGLARFFVEARGGIVELSCDITRAQGIPFERHIAERAFVEARRGQR